MVSHQFYTGNKKLFLGKMGEYIERSAMGQVPFAEMIEAHISKIQFDGLRALKVFPFLPDLDNKVGCITPSVASGRPFVEHHGIRTSVIWSRYQAGEKIQDLMKEYEVPEEAVSQAIEYSRRIGKAG